MPTPREQAQKIGGEGTGNTDHSAGFGELILEQLGGDSAWTRAEIEKTIKTA